MNSENYKAGYIAIIGRPNVGKSTLLNRLLDIKLSIVSPKPQTTRKRVIGFLSDDDSQAIFLDTPGMIEPQYQLQEKLMTYVTESVAESDAIILILSSELAEKKNLAQIKEFDFIKKTKKPLIVVINKIDILGKEILLEFMEKINKTFDTKDIIPISALKNIGIQGVKDCIKKYLPFHPPYYDPELLTEQPERFFVSEIIRETIFFQYQQEVPYSTEVIIDEFLEQEGKKDVIRATIWVERDSQKGILIGKGGEKLKKLGMRSRKDIELFLDRPVYLQLFVKVQDNWRQDHKRLTQLGY